MGEAPRPGAPILQGDATQPRPLAQDQLDGAAVQPRRRGIEPGGFGEERRFGALFEHDEAAAQIDAAAAHRRQRVKRLIDDHALGDVKERAAAPARGLQGGELVVADGDDPLLEDRPQPLGDVRRPVAPGCRRGRRGRPKTRGGCCRRCGCPRKPRCRPDRRLRSTATAAAKPLRHAPPAGRIVRGGSRGCPSASIPPAAAPGGAVRRMSPTPRGGGPSAMRARPAIEGRRRTLRR